MLLMYIMSDKDSRLLVNLLIKSITELETTIDQL